MAPAAVRGFFALSRAAARAGRKGVLAQVHCLRGGRIFDRWPYPFQQLDPWGGRAFDLDENLVLTPIIEIWGGQMEYALHPPLGKNSEPESTDGGWGWCLEMLGSASLTWDNSLT